MIDWNKYPKATRATLVYFQDDMLIADEEFDRPIQTKTVADAYNALKGKNPKITWTHVRFHKEDGFFFCAGDYAEVNGDDSCFVCTRTEFEAHVKEQEGEKWTHVDEYQNPCSVVIGKPDADGNVVILRKDGLYDCTHSSSVWLKPIKPTISEDAKRQLELYVQYRVDKYGDYAMKSDLSNYLSYHDIT